MLYDTVTPIKLYIYITIGVYYIIIGVLELMKTYYELKHLSHLDNVFIT